MVMNKQKLIPRGIYGIPEAARLLRSTPPLTNGHSVEPAKLRHWIRTSVVPPTSVGFPTRRRLISFRDLISMRLIAILRYRGLGVSEIKQTEEWMKAKLHVSWPFIWRPLWTYGSDAFAEFEHRLVVASRNGQIAMDFLRQWLTSVDLDMIFDSQDLVVAWSPYPGISIDPAIQLGTPCIRGTRIPTKTIIGKINAGETVDVLHALYDLSELEINRAIEWERRLSTN